MAATTSIGSRSICLVKQRYLAAVLIPVVLAVLLLLEFEYLGSTVSALSNTQERNIIGTYPGSAAEEERTLGSWAYAKRLLGEDRQHVRGHSPYSLMVVNLESIGTSDALAYIPEVGVLTDGRSFLAHGIEAITLRSFENDQFPRDLHSQHDSRDRLSINGIERSVSLLHELVYLADRASASVPNN